MSRAQERSTAIRAERAPTFSNPWGLLAITSTSGTGPRTSNNNRFKLLLQQPSLLQLRLAILTKQGCEECTRDTLLLP
jgi:hypothetical protein